MLADPDLDVRSLARSAGTALPYDRSEVVFREGGTADAMYVVASGTVELARRGRRIETIGQGRALGVLSLLDGLPRGVTATMREPGELVAIDARRFHAMVGEMPGFRRYIMAELAHRLRSTNAAL